MIGVWLEPKHTMGDCEVGLCLLTTCD